VRFQQKNENAPIRSLEDAVQGIRSGTRILMMATTRGGAPLANLVSDKVKNNYSCEPTKDIGHCETTRSSSKCPHFQLDSKHRKNRKQKATKVT